MKLSRLGTGASLLCLALASPAWSQATPPPAATETVPNNVPGVSPPTSDTSAQTSTATSGGLQDIVVTAQKRSENLQNVPISIVAVDGAALTNKGVGSTLDIGTVASGVDVRVNNSSFLPYIRGIGTNSSNTESPASLYIDGVYMPYSRGGLRALNDISQIAVLKGPQGTLFGRNSTAGVIQVTTRAPTQELHVEAGASVDNYETLHTDAYITGGLTKDLAASLSAEFGTQGIGWGRDLTTNNDTHKLARDVDVRGKAVFTPGPNTRITVIGEYYDQRFTGIARQLYDGTKLAYRGVASPLPSKFDDYANVDGYLENKGYSGSLTISQNLGFANLLSISAYQYEHSTLLFDNDLTALPAFTVSGDQPNRVITQELQLTSPTTGRFKWVVGGYYFNNHEETSPSTLVMRPPVGGPPPGLFIRRDGIQKTQSLAGFADGTFNFDDRTSLTAGVRYTWERRDLNDAQTTGVGALPTVLAAPVISHLTVRKPTFRVSLDREITPDVHGYISFNTGFKSGGYTITAPTAPAYLPETIRAYEAGLKTQMFDRRLRLNGAIFYYDYSNIQVSQVLQQYNYASVTLNGAKARLYGLDADMQALIRPNLQLSGGLSLLHARFTDFPGAQFATPLATGGALILPSPAFPTVTTNAAGKRLPSAPTVSANAALDYDTSLLGAATHFNVTGAYQSVTYFEPDNYIRQPGYVTLNSSIRFALPGDHVSVTFFGKNLLDERVITAGSASSTVISVVYDYPPRTYGASVRYRF